MNETRSLIAYFSRAGNNYVGGKIVNLPVGNTEVAAKMIRELTGGDIFRIDTIKTYPADYHETTDVAMQELRQNARPELAGHLDNMTDYGVVYLGYPNWWGTMPMAVFTFLEEYDLSGKIVAPFCTHEGSGLGRSVTDIAKLCPNSTIPDGLAVLGGEARAAQNKISEWLRKLGMEK
ncbi:MAG TPA: flavodoxin [Geobacteraceae bacterium]|nr:flavodoxin [Geobacteraceae bacterium]